MFPQILPYTSHSHAVYCYIFLKATYVTDYLAGWGGVTAACDPYLGDIMRIKETACTRCDGHSYSGIFYHPRAPTTAGTLNCGSLGNSFLEQHIIALSIWTATKIHTVRIINAGFKYLMRFH